MSGETLLVPDHLVSYIDKYCPEYHDDAVFQMKRAMRYVFINSVWEEPDFLNIIEAACVLRSGRTQWLYESVCREAVPALVRLKYGLSDKKMALAGVQFDRFTWFD